MPMIDPARAAHMEALATELDRTVERLNEALARQEELASEIGQVRRRNRWLVGATVAGFLVAVGASIAALTAFNTADDVRELNAAQEADRAAVSAAACIVRNASTLATDTRFNGMFDALKGLVSEQAQDDVEVLRNAGVAPLDQRYRDCDEDGVVADPGDFPSELAELAPVAD